MSGTAKQGAAMFYIDTVEAIRKGGASMPIPDDYGIEPGGAERIRSAIDNGETVILEDIPEVAMPTGMIYSFTFTVGQSTKRRITTAAKFRNGDQPTYTGAELIKNFVSEAKGRLGRLASMMGLDSAGRYHAAMLAIAILFRYMRMRPPVWLDPMAATLAGDASMILDDEISLAYAGALIAIESEAATAAMIEGLQSNDREMFESAVMNSLSMPEIQAARSRMGIGFSPVDLTLTSPAVWARFIQRTLATITGEST